MRAAWDFRRSITSARLLTELAVGRGVPLAAVLEGSGIAEDSLDDPSSEIEARQELALVRNVVRALPDASELGLEAGMRYHLTAYGIWGFTLASSPTLRKAVDLALRYFDLTFAFHRLGLEDADDEVRLVLDDRDVPEDVRRFLVERDVAAIVTLARELLGAPVPVTSLALRFPRPGHAARLREVFGREPEYDAERNVACFDARFLAQPLPQANPLTAKLCEDECRKLLARRTSRVGLAGAVRDHLLRDPRRMPDMEVLARALGATSRTLRRRLLDEGTSYRALADEVREALAEEMLASGLSTDDIAERLGYAEPASFLHAWKRWKGVSPREHRALKARAAAPRAGRKRNGRAPPSR